MAVALCFSTHSIRVHCEATSQRIRVVCKPVMHTEGFCLARKVVFPFITQMFI